MTTDSGFYRKSIDGVTGAIIPARHDRTPEVLATLRGIRHGVAWLCAVVTAFVVFAAAEQYRSHAGHSGGGAILAAPSRVQLQIVGVNAAEAIGHIGYLDGSEAEFAPGEYDVTSLAGASLEFTAGPGETLCRIVVDGVMVAEEFAADHGTAECRWNKP